MTCRHVVRRSVLSLVRTAPRKDAPDQHDLFSVVVVKDHAPVADAQPEVLAACQPSHVERAILDEETIESAKDARPNWWIKATQILLGGARKAQRPSAAHPA